MFEIQFFNISIITYTYSTLKKILVIIISQNEEISNLINIAKHWAQKSRFDHAIECIDKALNIEQSAELWLYKGLYYYYASEFLEQNYYEEALKFAEIAGDIDDNLEIIFDLTCRRNGYFMSVTGRYDAFRLESDCLEKLDRVCSKHITITNRSGDRDNDGVNQILNTHTKKSIFSQIVSSIFEKNK